MKSIFTILLLLLPKKLVLFANVTRLLEIMIQYLNPLMHSFHLAFSTVSQLNAMHLKLLDHAINSIRFFFPDISINLEKHRNIACLSMLHTILHNVTIHLITNSYNLQNIFVLLGIQPNKMIKLLSWLGITPINYLVFYLFYFLSLEKSTKSNNNNNLY